MTTKKIDAFTTIRKKSDQFWYLSFDKKKKMYVNRNQSIYGH